jgi:hypothetical protein
VGGNRSRRNNDNCDNTPTTGFYEFASNRFYDFAFSYVPNDYAVSLLLPTLSACCFFVAFWFIQRISYLVGRPASTLLNSLTAAQMRSNAFGNDIHTRVVRVAPVPEGFNANYGLVPETIEAALRAFSDKHAVETIARARQVLGLFQETQGREDLAGLFADQLSWRELIHSGYFDVEEFAKLRELQA